MSRIPETVIRRLTVRAVNEPVRDSECDGCESATYARQLDFDSVVDDARKDRLQVVLGQVVFDAFAQQFASPRRLTHLPHLRVHRTDTHTLAIIRRFSSSVWIILLKPR